jgi:hypothetical protein
MAISCLLMAALVSVHGEQPEGLACAHFRAEVRRLSEENVGLKLQLASLNIAQSTPAQPKPITKPSRRLLQTEGTRHCCAWLLSWSSGVLPSFGSSESRAPLSTYRHAHALTHLAPSARARFFFEFGTSSDAEVARFAPNPQRRLAPQRMSRALSPPAKEPRQL